MLIVGLGDGECDFFGEDWQYPIDVRSPEGRHQGGWYGIEVVRFRDRSV